MIPMEEGSLATNVKNLRNYSRPTSGKSNVFSMKSNHGTEYGQKTGSKLDIDMNRVRQNDLSRIKIDEIHESDFEDMPNLMKADEMKPISSLKEEVSLGKMMIRLEKQKHQGILPSEFKYEDIAVSFSKASSLKDMHDESNWAIMSEEPSIYDYLVISMDNPYFNLWSIFHTLSCLSSSYFYAYMAAFDYKEVVINANGEEETVYNQGLLNLYLVFEIIFLISLIINFFVEYRDPETTTIVRDLKKIGMRYIYGEFTQDFLPILPLVHIFNFGGGREKHLFVIKLLRLITGLRIFNVSKIMQKIKYFN